MFTQEFKFSLKKLKFWKGRIGRGMGKSLSRRKKKQNQILGHALFGKSVAIRMQALILLTQNETVDGGWLLETTLNYENLTVKQ